MVAVHHVVVTIVVMVPLVPYVLVGGDVELLGIPARPRRMMIAHGGEGCQWGLLSAK